MDELEFKSNTYIWSTDPQIKIELKAIDLSIDFLHFAIYKMQVDSISYTLYS